jgi:hypothetical protein
MNFIRPENLLLRSLPGEICRDVLSQSEPVHLDLRESLDAYYKKVMDEPVMGVLANV